MKFLLSSIFMLFSISFYAQCAECPSGSIVITGTTNISDQNNANDYCITGIWTGTITGIGNNSSITICPSATWEISSNFISQQNILITSYGTITDGGNGYLFKIQGQTDLVNKSSGSITVEMFENQDTEFTNEGSLIAEDIYLHGPSFNSGTIESTATDCNGMATTSCGFFMGNKNQSLNNTGTVTVVDGMIRDGVVGGGEFISTGTLAIESNGGTTDNNFNVNNLSLQSSSNVSDGIFVVNGDLNCNNANVTAIVCLDGGTESTACSGSSVPIVECSVLPVNIVAFEIKQNQDKLIYTWEVRSEANVSHYEIYHSVNGQEFSKIAEQEASKSTFYQLVSSASEENVSYYKLKSVDLDGTVDEFDQVRIVRKSDFLSFKISPNPASKNEFVNIQFDDKLDALVEVFSLTGEKISSTFFNNQSKINLNLSKIQVSGLYLIKISTPTGSYTEQVFVQ